MYETYGMYGWIEMLLSHCQLKFKKYFQTDLTFCFLLFISKVKPIVNIRNNMAKFVSFELTTISQLQLTSGAYRFPYRYPGDAIVPLNSARRNPPQYAGMERIINIYLIENQFIHMISMSSW